MMKLIVTWILLFGQQLALNTAVFPLRDLLVNGATIEHSNTIPRHYDNILVHGRRRTFENSNQKIGSTIVRRNEQTDDDEVGDKYDEQLENTTQNNDSPTPLSTQSQVTASAQEDAEGSTAQDEETTNGQGEDSAPFQSGLSSTTLQGGVSTTAQEGAADHDDGYFDISNSTTTQQLGNANDKVDSGEDSEEGTGDGEDSDKNKDMEVWNIAKNASLNAPFGLGIGPVLLNPNSTTPMSPEDATTAEEGGDDGATDKGEGDGETDNATVNNGLKDWEIAKNATINAPFGLGSAPANQNPNSTLSGATTTYEGEDQDGDGEDQGDSETTTSSSSLSTNEHQSSNINDQNKDDANDSDEDATGTGLNVTAPYETKSANGGDTEGDDNYEEEDTTGTSNVKKNNSTGLEGNVVKNNNNQTTINDSDDADSDANNEDVETKGQNTEEDNDDQETDNDDQKTSGGADDNEGEETIPARSPESKFNNKFTTLPPTFVPLEDDSVLPKIPLKGSQYNDIPTVYDNPYYDTSKGGSKDGSNGVYNPPDEEDGRKYKPPSDENDPIAKGAAEEYAAETQAAITWKDKTPTELAALAQLEAHNMIHDKYVKLVVVLATFLGVALMLLVAQQIVENPNGLCSKLCRCAVGLVRCIILPIRLILCCEICNKRAQERRTHSVLQIDDDFDL